MTAGQQDPDERVDEAEGPTLDKETVKDLDAREETADKVKGGPARCTYRTQS
ncbi:MAG TPA: hypothetical protein VF512_04445 [Actinomycetota bacterium]|jgi:hypothetical protein